MFIISVLFLGSLGFHNRNNWEIIPNFDTEEIISNTFTPPPQQWNSTWGTPWIDQCNGVTLDPDGNIYLAGSFNNSGSNSIDLTLIKYNKGGGQVWNSSWGENESEYGDGLTIDTSGCLYVVGHQLTSGGNVSGFLIKFDVSADEIWNHTWDDWYAQDVAVNGNNEVYVVGYAPINEYAVIVKVNSSGNMQWTRIWNHSSDIYGYGVAVDGNDVYFTGNFHNGTNNQDIFLMKYNSTGHSLWNVSWGSIDTEHAYDVDAKAGDGCYIVGLFANISSQHTLLLKYNSTGNLIWSRISPISPRKIGRAITIQQNLLYIAGSVGPFGGENASLRVYDLNGLCVWNTTWGGFMRDEAFDIVVNTEGIIYIVGNTDNFGLGTLGKPDIFIVKFGVEESSSPPPIHGFLPIHIVIILGIMSVIVLFKRKGWIEKIKL